MVMSVVIATMILTSNNDNNNDGYGCADEKF